jgi:hypothetical protein
MARSRSIRFSSRARTTERGFALIAAIVLAVLYFALIQLLLVDSARELAEARRFKARIVAATLAENGAELAALQITAPGQVWASPTAEDWQGKISGDLKKASGGDFTIEGKGTSSGLNPTSAGVTVIGKVEGTRVKIYYTTHVP